MGGRLIVSVIIFTARRERLAERQSASSINFSRGMSLNLEIQIITKLRQSTEDIPVALLNSNYLYKIKARVTLCNVQKHINKHVNIIATVH